MFSNIKKISNYFFLFVFTRKMKKIVFRLRTKNACFLIFRIKSKKRLIFFKKFFYGFLFSKMSKRFQKSFLFRFETKTKSKQYFKTKNDRF